MLAPSRRLVGFDPATRATRVLTPCLLDCFGGWSPDGRWLAYTSDCDPVAYPCTQKWGLWVERAGAPPRRLIPHPSGPWSWAPHGSMLADMFKPYDRPTTLAVVNPVTGRERVLTRIHGFVKTQFAWSPDGTRIAFQLWTNLDIIPVYGGTPVTIPLGGIPNPPRPWLAAFSWSPDGRRIAIGVDYKAHWGAPRVPRVYVVSASGSQRPQLLGRGDGPQWSPNGRWIAYSGPSPTGRGFNESLWTVRPDGSHRAFLGATSNCTTAVWSPNGTRLAWSVDLCRAFVESPAGHPDVRPFTRVRMREWLQAPSRVYLDSGRGF